MSRHTNSVQNLIRATLVDYVRGCHLIRDPHSIVIRIDRPRPQIIVRVSNRDVWILLQSLDGIHVTALQIQDSLRDDAVGPPVHLKERTGFVPSWVRHS